MADLPGKTMIISGVGPGLGRRVALCAAREGANVVLAARTETQLVEVANEVDSTGQTVAYVTGDIALASTAEALVAAATERFGGVDSICHCAAFSPFGGLEAAGDFSDFRQAFEVNLIGGMQLIREALPSLKERRGSVVFVSSQSQWFPPPEALQMAYAASKGAIWGAMHHLALEIGPVQVRVNEVAPGWMWGPPVQEYVRMMADQAGTTETEASSGIVRDIPLGHMASDSDV